MTNPWETQPGQPDNSPPEGESPVPENQALPPDSGLEEAEIGVDEGLFGPWAVADTEFTSFTVGREDGLSILAICVDEQGHELEYSVSLIRSRNNDGDRVAQADESDENLKARLIAIVAEEVNSPARKSLIAKRFTE